MRSSRLPLVRPSSVWPWSRLLVVGWAVLAGCATSGPPRPTAAVAAPAPVASVPGPCADAASCRAALGEARRQTNPSSCEAQRRGELARRACEVGVAEGCTLLGREPETEPATARGLFERGCAGGDAEGCARHALMTLLGEGCERDTAAGQAELREACERAPASACGLAVSSLVAEARQRDAEPEWEWLALFAQRGCDAGDGAACRMLGDVFYAGHGVSADLEKAAELYARACEGGDGQACAQQGMLLPANAVETHGRADDLFTRGCDLGSAEACRLIVLKTLGNHGDVGDGNVRRALFRHACDQGAAVGCLALYDLLREQPAEPGTSLQLPALLKRACRLGEAQACEFLEDVARTAQPRCARGSAAACGVMGVLLLSPPTVGGEAAEGLRLLRRACAEGDTASCSLLNDRTLPTEDLTCQAR